MVASSPRSNNSEESGFVPFTKAERIRQLNNIDQSINRLLKSAGLAIQILSAARIEAPQTDIDRQHSFEENCNNYFRTLQIIDIGLHRQIHGLEEAGIIPADKSKKEKASIEAYPTAASARLLQEKDTVSNDGGMGKFDIGLLNSQSGSVARNMESELWEKARLLLEELNTGINNIDSKDEEDKQLITNEAD
ncbi:hypothetical protein K3495_g10567 [Podosphaera aphanis]|nr:hypothetical protein K3495_g10567 [Podosphaera aphanis]